MATDDSSGNRYHALIERVFIERYSEGDKYVLPVQAKGRKDQLSSVQKRQDFEWCAQRFPQHHCRPISAQFLNDDLVAMFELGVEGSEIRVLNEKHYRLSANSSP